MNKVSYSELHKFALPNNAIMLYEREYFNFLNDMYVYSHCCWPKISRNRINGKLKKFKKKKFYFASIEFVIKFSNK